ncbi:MAG: rhodanese-like domain-containing protein [Sandaracinaceae bacterium]|jgi:rhodanese-related sulfurtransferase|nr:rhodanese-like domain-containing protein [Sandaracinaceae bacterium]
MKSVVVEALLVSLVGALLGTAHGIVRGWPWLPPAHESPTGTCSAPVPTEPTIQWMSQADARRFSDDRSVMFVDARTADEYEEGHVTNAISLPYSSRETPHPNFVTLLRTAHIVIVYCDTTASCSQSTNLASQLLHAGLTDVRVLEGGFPAWMNHGYPAEAGACRLCP